MSRAEAELRQAIERCYAAFARVPRPQRLDTSPVHDAEEMLRALTAAPLRDLTGEQIGPFSGSAMTTAGDEHHYRHFLPRILELAIDDPAWLGTEPPVIASRLKMAAWRGWPADQQSAVLHFFRAAFAAMLERHPRDATSAAEWFCGLIGLGDPPSLSIARWRASASPNAVLHMAAFIADEAKYLRRGATVRGAFWQEVSEEARAEVGKLLLSGATMNFLVAGVGRVSDEDCFYFLDTAVAELERQF